MYWGRVSVFLGVFLLVCFAVYPIATMNCGCFLLVTALLLVGVAYYLYTPFPDNAVEPQKQMVLSFFVAFIFKICYFQEYFGFTTWYKFIRNPFNIMALAKNRNFSDENVEVTDEFFDGVKVKLYIPRDAKGPLPGIIFLHGGGWVFGDPEQYHPLTKTLAKDLPAVVASVDYRLAPEHPFPVPFEDTLKATLYFMSNAEKYGVDPDRIALTGDSAGGNLAMAVGARLTEKGQPPRLLGLIYPSLQMVNFNTPSYKQYTSAPYIMQQRLMVTLCLNYAFGHETYVDQFIAGKQMSDILRMQITSKVNLDLLPEKYQSFLEQNERRTTDKALAEKVYQTITNKYISPLMMDDEELKRLPKSYLLTCEYDPLRDEGLILAQRWKDMGFPVKHVHYDGLQHSFFAAVNVLNTTEKAIADFVNYLKAEL